MSIKENYKESLVDLLMATLGSARSTHIFKNILFKRKLKRYKKESIKVTLSRLHSKGYVKKSFSGWSLTQKGENHIKKPNMMDYLPSPFKKNQLSSIIISFDIPEKDRKIRNWLRNQIKIFGYKILQQSLWIGPGPLPHPFLKRLEKLEIRDKVKV